jgi:hypothetical protein
MNAFGRRDPGLTEEQRRVLATLTPAQRAAVGRGRRYRSEREFLGMPLVAVAVGPDPERREARGHAKGVIAIGDVATGIVAFGGWARGVVAVGGLATGVIACGGLAFGLAAAFGGIALSAMLAIGGGALGTAAFGGAAAGYYAVGGAPYGTYVVGPERVDPEALALFERLGLEPPAPPRPVRTPAPAR